MADENARVWQLIEKVSICMLATWDGHEIHARPMSACPRPTENLVLFLTDARHHKDVEIEQFPKVTLVFSDPSGQKYVSVVGNAKLSNDRAAIKKLWSTPAKAWWESADDPNIRLLSVTPVSAEYWDAPGTVMSYAKMMLAAVTGARPEIGENRTLSM